MPEPTIESQLVVPVEEKPSWRIVETATTKRLGTALWSAGAQANVFSPSAGVKFIAAELLELSTLMDTLNE